MKAIKLSGWSLGLICLCGSFVPRVALATIVPRMPFEQLMDDSALVVAAKVERVRPDAYDKETKTAYTVVELLVTRAFFGNIKEGQRIAFAIPGGIYPDGTVSMTAGSPILNEDRIYLLFIRTGEWHLTPITNWWHSVFKEVEVEGGRFAVAQSGRCVTGLTDQGFEIGPRIADPEPVPWQDDSVVETDQGELDRSAYKANAAACPTADKVYAEMQGLIGDYLKLHPFIKPRSFSADPTGISLSKDDGERASSGGGK